jgi:hypothetical protein
MRKQQKQNWDLTNKSNDYLRSLGIMFMDNPSQNVNSSENVKSTLPAPDIKNLACVRNNILLSNFKKQG